jgi:cytochrome c-type biogenesis protein CcmE
VKRYWRFLLPAGALVVVIVVLLVNLGNNLVFFATPTELTDGAPGAGRQRLGGQVVAGSVAEADGEVRFDVTDGITAVSVVHTGAPAELFEEGIGVVVEGTWDGTVFRSDVMLIRHDEQYRTEDGRVYDDDNPGSFAP